MIIMVPHLMNDSACNGWELGAAGSLLLNIVLGLRWWRRRKKNYENHSSNCQNPPHSHSNHTTHCGGGHFKKNRIILILTAWYVVTKNAEAGTQLMIPEKPFVGLSTLSLRCVTSLYLQSILSFLNKTRFKIIVFLIFSWDWYQTFQKKFSIFE